MNVGKLSQEPKGVPSGPKVLLQGKGAAIDIANIPTSMAELQDPFKMGVLQSLGTLLPEFIGSKESLTYEQRGGLLIVRGRLNTIRALLKTRPDWLAYVDNLLNLLKDL